LEKVTGGCIGTDDPHFANFSGYVNMYCLEENKEYYFTKKKRSGTVWFKGTVSKTWEKKDGLFTTERTHKVNVSDLGTCLGDGWSVNDTIEINGDNYAVYKNKG